MKKAMKPAKTLMVRKPLPPFTPMALHACCPLCGYGRRGSSISNAFTEHTVRAAFDSLQQVSFLTVTCFRCGALIERYGPAKP